MPLFSGWCDSERRVVARKRLWKFTEKDGGRDAVEARLIETIRSHYDSMDRIADDVKRFGYPLAARVLSERLPRSSRARSAELGEILAVELIEEETSFIVPVRRLRYKDGREMALRGDDLIGVRAAPDGLRLLKGESKSRSALNKATVDQARVALSSHAGRCTPSSLLFVSDRLMEREGTEADLGRAIREEVGTQTMRPQRIGHVLFTLSGNAPPKALEDDLWAAEETRLQIAVNVRIEDHQEFIAEVYEKAAHLGDN